MTALDLHNKLFTSATDKRSSVPLNRTLSLTTVQDLEQDSPTALSFNSSAYLDLLSRQPLHPDGPRHWDLGLDFTGDPATAAERKSLEDRTTRAKLRRLQMICVVFEVVLGLWAAYCTVRYFLAFNTTSIPSVHTLALVLYIVSIIAVVGVVVSLCMPLLPEGVFVCASPTSFARTVLRGCYILLIVAIAITNLVFVLLWRPIDRCNWDVDVAWSTSIRSISHYCHITSFAAWTIAASLRVIVTLIFTLLYLYCLRMYFVTRHPSKYASRMRYPSSMVLNEEPDSPVSSSPSTSYQIKSEYRRSSSTLAPESTISSTTLAPTLSLSSQTRSSIPAIKSHSHMSSTRSPSIWPNWTRFAAAEARPMRHQGSHGRSDALRTPGWNDRTPSERFLRNPDSGLAGASVKCTEVHVHTVVSGTSQVIPDASYTTTAAGEYSSFDRTSSAAGELGDSGPVSSYGYGASQPEYPYLDVYNPSIGRRHDSVSPADATQQPRLSAAFIPGRGDSVEHVTMMDDSAEDELIPIMGGFVRRMATIESLGSREAATSIARSRLSRFSENPASPSSSLRLATCTPSITSTLSKNNSLGTVYFSVSSGMMDSGLAAVNEQGELEAKITNPPSYSRYNYTRG